MMESVTTCSPDLVRDILQSLSFKGNILSCLLLVKQGGHRDGNPNLGEPELWLDSFLSVSILQRPTNSQVLSTLENMQDLKEEGEDGVPAVVQWVNDLACLCGGTGSIPGLAQWVKDPVLLQLWHSFQLWLGFDPWPRYFHMLQVWVKKNKKGEKRAKAVRSRLLMEEDKEISPPRSKAKHFFPGRRKDFHIFIT